MRIKNKDTGEKGHGVRKTSCGDKIIVITWEDGSKETVKESHMSWSYHIEEEK